MWSPVRDYNFPVHQLLDAAARRHLRDFSGRVLDIGCGTSPYRRHLPPSASYVGIDRARQPDARARAAVETLPFADAAFDGVICTEVIEQSRRPWQALAEIARVLRPGGRLYLTAPFDWHFFDEPYDYFRFTTHGVRALLEDAGFVVSTVERVGGMFSALSGKLLEELVQGVWLRAASAVGISRGAYLTAALASLPYNALSMVLAPPLDRLSARNPFSVAAVAVRR
ncbi:MAG TPA: class I SAM-dependent methyltransferase [Polyangia bacterium]